MGLVERRHRAKQLASHGQAPTVRSMNSQYTAIVKQSGKWWIGWIEEVPGVNAQEKTKDELLVSLRDVLKEALEFNREEARRAAVSDFSEEPVVV
jgi:predicted RNase H-like HicB family nuclease